MEYPIETFLRLPMYLQQAGRFDEALIEFKLMLQGKWSSAGAVREKHRVGARLLELVRVYDKMRLACQRQKRQDFAVSCGLLAYGAREAADAIHPRRASRAIAGEELDDLREELTESAKYLSLAVGRPDIESYALQTMLAYFTKPTPEGFSAFRDWIEGLVPQIKA
jgi:NTP pyrophosphatase (non-canonical NTP hydrolase)